jgi:hypothetical protein
VGQTAANSPRLDEMQRLQATHRRNPQMKAIDPPEGMTIPMTPALQIQVLSWFPVLVSSIDRVHRLLAYFRIANVMAIMVTFEKRCSR